MLLEKQAEKQMTKRKDERIKRIKACKNLDDVIKSRYCEQFLTKRQLEKLNSGELTLPEAKKIMIARIEKDFTKELSQQLNKIKSVKASSRINSIRCEIDWVKNNTWGYCPKGCYRNGYKYQEFKSITGHGFDKLSTLMADMFNSDNNLIAFVIDYIEKHHINEDNIEYKLGYGIKIYNGMPHFSHGVGVDCYETILLKLGFKVQHFSTEQSDIIIIDRIK